MGKYNKRFEAWYDACMHVDVYIYIYGHGNQKERERGRICGMGFFLLGLSSVSR